MATTDTELKKLNKTVDEAVNIMKMYVGNSAQLKNMNEKQREAVDKWFDVNESAEDNQKKQRAFVERTRDENGRFIKKKEVQANKIMGMAGSVKGMFSNATKTIGSSVKNLAAGITQNLQSFFTAVKSQFLSLFGEESEWFDILNSIKESVMGFAGWFAKGFTMIFRRSPTWAKSMVKSLKDIYKLQVKQMKMDFMDAGGDKKKGVSIMGLLGALVFSIGAAIGAFMHRYFVMITKLPIFARVAQWFTKLDDIPFIGKLFKAIKFGFKWLGWPLTVILSVIDFIKGYSETEGSMFEKIKEGLWSALEGFIELPVQFIGWVVEKVLGWFGVEANGIGDKIMGFMKDAFMMVLDGWALIFGLVKDGIMIAIDAVTGMFNKIKDPIMGIVDEILNPTGKWTEALVGAVTSIVAGVHNFFVDFWNSVVEWVSNKIPNWMPKKDSIMSGLTSMQMSRMESPVSETSPVDSANEVQRYKINKETGESQKLSDALDELGKGVKDSNRKTGDAINTIASMKQGGGGGATVDTQQIPDELDNQLVSVGNYNGGTD